MRRDSCVTSQEAYPHSVQYSNGTVDALLTVAYELFRFGTASPANRTFLIGVLKMANPYVHYVNDVDETFHNVQNEANGRDLKTKAQQVGRNVRAKIEQSREPAAEKLRNAASALHGKADHLPGGETVAGMAHKTADTMQATAEYVRQHNLQDMAADVNTFVRKRPGQSLLAAIAAGFLIGRTLRRHA